jgi:DNA-directed RNA polymerase I, II, and III subunit RPABC5
MVIADKYRFYKNEVIKRKTEKGYDIEKVVYLKNNFKEKTIEADVMDDLGLTKLCCRRHFLTHVDIE